MASFKSIQRDYRKISSPPTPNVEGPIEREIFGVKSYSCPNKMEIKKIIPGMEGEETTLVCNRGSLHGVSKGSIYCLVPSYEDIPSKGENWKKKTFFDQNHRSGCFGIWSNADIEKISQGFKKSSPGAIFKKHFWTQRHRQKNRRLGKPWKSHTIMEIFG